MTVAVQLDGSRPERIRNVAAEHVRTVEGAERNVSRAIGRVVAARILGLDIDDFRGADHNGAVRGRDQETDSYSGDDRDLAGCRRDAG